MLNLARDPLVVRILLEEQKVLPDGRGFSPCYRRPILLLILINDGQFHQERKEERPMKALRLDDRPMLQPVGGQTLLVYRLLVPRVDIKPSPARRLVDFAGDKKENPHPITDYFYHVGWSSVPICFSGNEPTC